MPEFQISRRETIGALAASAALPLFAKATPGWAKPASDAQASALLDSVAENLLRLDPANATVLGLDVGRGAELRSQLSDRSAAGQRRLRRPSKPISHVSKHSTIEPLSFPVRTSVEVVRSAYSHGHGRFCLPLWRRRGRRCWRNTPYVVIQNVGAYIDTPQFLDTDHPIENRRRCRGLSQPPCAVSRANSTASSSGCARLERKGLVPPNFLIDKALAQLAIAREGYA